MTNLTNVAQWMPWWGSDVKGLFSLGKAQGKVQHGAFTPQTLQALTALMAAFDSSLQEKRHES